MVSPAYMSISKSRDPEAGYLIVNLPPAMEKLIPFQGFKHIV